MWSKKPMPLASLLVPLPSRSTVTRIFVSFVLRSTSARRELIAMFVEDAPAPLAAMREAAGRGVDRSARRPEARPARCRQGGVAPRARRVDAKAARLLRSGLARGRPDGGRRGKE